jgi:hypothetical protein
MTPPPRLQVWVLLCTEESKMSESEFADSDLTFEQKEEI